jgi:hypothetical protein
MSAGHPESQLPDASVGHEESDVSARPITISAAAIAAICAAAIVAMLVLFNLLARFQAAQTAAPSPLAASYGLKEPPEPRLQTDPRQDLLDLRARDGAAIGAYAWADKQAGIVRIPVERAIALLAERGLPARPVAPKGQP